jgi:zinc protease
MALRTRTHLLFLAAALALAACFTGTRQQAAIIPAQAQTSVQTSAQSLSEPMPVDPQITMGKFPNGMRYYIRNNKKPEKRAELRLVVKAGSILEDDDQQGLAHLVEHMAFNGTSHFPKNELVSFIESLGMRFGADVNAYTSFDGLCLITLACPKTRSPEVA